MAHKVIPGSFHALTKSSVRVKVVDIGANPLHGAPPYHKLLRGGNADLVGFEPNPVALAELNKQKNPGEIYLPSAIGDGKRHTLHLCAVPDMNSLLRPNPEVLNLLHGFPRWGSVVSTEEIDTMRLDDIPETEGADLIHLDVQGAELMVFQNALRRLADAVVIHTEVEFLPLYIDQPLFGDIDVFLRGQGYLFHRFSPIVSRTIQPMLLQDDVYAGMSQVIWADAIYVRDLTKLSHLTPRQLLAAAAILHDSYQSYDVVLRILLEHDRQTGERVAPTYMANLTGQPDSAAN